MKPFATATNSECFRMALASPQNQETSTPGRIDIRTTVTCSNHKGTVSVTTALDSMDHALVTLTIQIET